MKHVVRILVTILILGLVGGGIWYFCFRTKPNEVVFKEMTETKTHLEDEVAITGLDGIVYKGYSKIVDYYEGITNYKRVENSVENNEISKTNELNNIKQNVQTLLNLNNNSSKAINYYYSLTASAEKVKNADRKSLVNTITEYNKAIDELVACFGDVVNAFGSRIVISTTYPDDAGYKDLVDINFTLYKKALTKQSIENELFFKLRDYVNKYVFKTFVPDLKSAMYDVYVQQLNILCEELNTKVSELNNFINGYKSDYLTETQKIGYTINHYESDEENSYFTNDSAAFLDAYKNLSSEDLLKILRLDNTKDNENQTYGESGRRQVLETLDLNENNFMEQLIYNTIFEKLNDDDSYTRINTETYFTEAEKQEFKRFTIVYEYDSKTFEKADLDNLIDGNYVNNAVTKAELGAMLKSFFNQNITTKIIYLNNIQNYTNINKDILEYGHNLLVYAFAYDTDVQDN